MRLRERLDRELKEAIRNRENVRKLAIRDILTSIREAEQRKREDLVTTALAKHNVRRPSQNDIEAMEAYQQQIDIALEMERVDEQTALTNEEIAGLIQKMAKQRRESIEEAYGAQRPELAEGEEAELEVLMSFLPDQLDREQIEVEAKAMIESVGAEDMRDMGKVMGTLMERLQGRADGKLVSEVVRDLLNNSEDE